MDYIALIERFGLALVAIVTGLYSLRAKNSTSKVDEYQKFRKDAMDELDRINEQKKLLETRVDRLLAIIIDKDGLINDLKAKIQYLNYQIKILGGTKYEDVE